MLPLLCISGFLFASMGTITLFRSTFEGPLYCSRYLIYPHFLFAITFVFLLVKLKERKITRPLIIIFTLLMLVNYNMDKGDGVFGFEFLNKTLKNTDYYYPDKNGAKEAAESACRLQIYCIEKHR